MRSVLRLLGLMLLTSIINCAYATWPGSGYAWYYNDQAKRRSQEQKATHKVMDEFEALSPLQKTNLLRRVFLNAIDRAKFNPTDENIERALRWQQFFANQASDFTQGAVHALLLHPDLDYEVSHPQSSVATNVSIDQRRITTDKVIESLAHRYWLYVFYRGQNPLDQLYIKSVATFAKTYGFELVGISVDGRVLSTLTHNVPNQGQAQAMGVRAFPALVLVNAAHRSFKPVAYGFQSLNELRQDFYNVGVNFKRWW